MSLRSRLPRGCCSVPIRTLRAKGVATVYRLHHGVAVRCECPLRVGTRSPRYARTATDFSRCLGQVTMPSLEAATLALAAIGTFAAFVNGALGYGFSSLTV